MTHGTSPDLHVSCRAGCRAGCKAGTPAALANLLLEAPQAVPFPDRVALIRALIEADKARSVPSSPGQSIA